MHIHHKMRGEKNFEKEKAITIYHSNVSCDSYGIQHDDRNGRAIG